MPDESASRKQGSSQMGVAVLSGNLISLILHGVMAIILARLLLPDNFGLYYVALVPVSLLSIIRNMGFPIAVQYYSTHAKIEKTPGATRAIGVAGIIWELSIGGLLSIFLFLLINPISTLLSIPAIVPIIAVSIPLLISSGVHLIIYNLSIGDSRPNMAAFILIFEASIKTLLIVLFVVLGYGPLGAMTGYSLSSVIAAFTAVIAITRFKGEKNRSVELKKIRFDISKMLNYAVHVGVSQISYSLVGQISLLIGAILIGTYWVGIFSLANTLFLYLFVIFTHLTLVLISVLAKYGNNRDDLQKAFRSSTLLSATITGFPSLLCAVYSNFIITLLFGVEYQAAEFMLVLLCTVNILLAPIGLASSGALLLSKGHSKQYSIFNVLSMVLTLPITFIAILEFGVYGLVLGVFLKLAIPIFLYNIFISRSMKINTIGVANIKMILLFTFLLVVGRSALQWTISWPVFIHLSIPLILIFPLGLLLLIRLRILEISDIELLLSAIPDTPFLQKVISGVLRVVTILSPHNEKEEKIDLIQVGDTESQV